MSVSFGSETQQDSAQRMYSHRASTYEDSWHPDYSRRFITYAPLRPGDRVLDLCCGTDLDAFLAAEIVGEDGQIVGVDVTKGMLKQLHERQKREPVVGKRITTIQHDVTDLSGLAGEGVEKESFDAIICSCAFVLFHDPASVVAHWKHFLRPGGVMVIDITHEHNLRAGMVMELVAKEIGAIFPSNRLWIKSQDSFKEILEVQGMMVENVVLVDNVQGKGTQLYGVDEASRLYETIINSSLTVNVVPDDFREAARPLFLREWERVAVDGMVEDTDSLYVYTARKPE